MEPAERVGALIAEKYRLDEVLGRGGMGAVYRATHVKVGKRFAVKILHAEIAEHREAARRFLQEAQASSRIGHPGILDVYDAGEADGVLYMVTELLEGESLAQRIARGPLPVDEAVMIAEQVLEPLEAAHRAGVVHRDVKPHNIFLVEPGTASQERPSAPDARRVKLLDFGIAKFTATDVSALTRTGTLIGSPLYMAPEQAKAEPDVDARADVWSVGATLFEMLVGSPAHAAPTPVAVVARILMSPAPPPSSQREGIEPALDVIVQRALTIDREKRFATAGDMRAALVRFRTGVAETATWTPPPSLEAASSGASSGRSSGAGAGASSSRRSSPSSTRASKGGLESTPPTAATGPGSVRTAAPWSGRARFFVVALGLGAGAAGALAWMRHRAPSEVPVAETHATIAPAAPSAALSAPAAASASTTSAGATSAGTTSDVATAPSDAGHVASAPADAGRAMGNVLATTGATTAAASNHAHAAPAACAAGEHVSSGHCCARGLEWQVDRCDRPLATTLPF